MKILTTVGTRPQFLKLAPLSKKFEEEKINHVVVHTGQHYDKEMSDNLFKVLNIKEPDYLLEKIGSTSIQSLGDMMNKIEEICLKEKPDKLIVFGDCDSTIAGAIVARKLKIYLIHIEAGMRSYNKDMPEEINRLMTDHISDLLLCSTQDSVEKLKAENITNNVHFVGNLQLELLKNVCDTYHDTTILNENNLTENNFALMTIHREYNTNKEMLEKIFLELEKLDIDIVFPIHPRTNNIVNTNNINIPKNLNLIKPVDYLNMSILERNCKFIITDSGGVQPEAWYLRKKCIIMRSETEWIEPLVNNNNILYDYNTPLNEFINDFLEVKIEKDTIDYNICSHHDRHIVCNISKNIIFKLDTLYMEKKVVRKTIYFLHCRTPIIKPISGDQITEISIMKCLSLYYDVYYNNQLIDFNKPNFGLTETKVQLPNKKYDYYWTRNNDDVLLNCPGIKIRCGAPYTENSYNKSDIIVCYSKSWEEKLNNYNNKYVESANLYPKSKIIIPKNTMTVYQSIESRFFDRITNSEKANYRNKMVGTNCDFLIAHFGRISSSCYPTHLLPAFNKLCKRHHNKNLKLLFCGKFCHFKLDIQTNNPNVIINKIGIDHEDIHKYIQSCDLITSDYNSPTADWGGCMHILESMACGVPVLCGNFDVRKEQLGDDYPFFWDKNGKDNLIIQQILTILENILSKKIDITCVCEDLVKRSKNYTTKIVAKNIYNNLENMLF